MNSLILGDAIEEMRKLPSGSVDLILTDPPYSTTAFTAQTRKGMVKNMADLSIQEFYLKSFRDEASRLLKGNGRLFIFCDERYYPVLFSVFYSWKTKMLIWDKVNIGLGNPFRNRHEVIMYASCGELYKPNLPGGMEHWPTVLQYKSDQNKEHEAQKPIALVRDLISGFSKEGDVVLDPFLGSGTTALAAAQTNRWYIGIELNPKYLEIARSRVAEAESRMKSKLPV